MKLFCAIFIVMSTLVLTEALGDAFLKRIFASSGYPNGVSYQNFNYETTTKKVKVEKQRGRSFKEICRAVNPAPYSFPNKIPYPSVPIC